MNWLKEHYKAVTVFWILTVATLSILITFICLVIQKESVYLAGVISSGVIFIIELILWVNLIKWMLKYEKES